MQGMLSEFAIFSDISQDKLAEIEKHCEIRKFNQNDIIFDFGGSATNLYGVLDGEVELILVFKEIIHKTDIEYEESIQTRSEVLEKPIVIDTLGPGEIFGWSSMVSPGKWTATARCSTLANLLSLPGAGFKAMLDKDPELGYSVMGKLCEIISQRLNNRTEKLIESWGEAFEVGKI